MFTLKWKQLQCVVSGCTVSPFPLQSPGASCRLSLVRPSMFICLWRSMYGERGGRIGPCSPIHEATEWPLLPILTPPSHCFVHHNGGNHVLSVFCILVCSSWWVIEGEKFQISMTKKMVHEIGCRSLIGDVVESHALMCHPAIFIARCIFNVENLGTYLSFTSRIS